MHAMTDLAPSTDRLFRLLALIACLIAGGVLVEQLVTGPRLPTSDSLALPIPRSSDAEDLPPPDWRLFGEPAEQDWGLTPVEPTPLALRLRGAVAGEGGYAIILDADGNEGVYRVGDELPGDARVTEIDARRVLLRRNGRIEALELPGSALTRDARPAPARAQRSTDGGSMSGIGAGSLSSLTSQFTLDADVLAQRITILPVAGGGFRVRAGRDASLFTQLGFHANDIVTAINGQPVSTQADVRAVFENYNPGERVAITVRRGDRQLVLTPDLAGFR